jgi:hypothetical protein
LANGCGSPACGSASASRKLRAAAKVTLTTWRKYEAGGGGYCTIPIVNFGQHFGLSLDWLFVGDGPAPAYRRPRLTLVQGGAAQERALSLNGRGAASAALFCAAPILSRALALGKLSQQLFFRIFREICRIKTKIFAEQVEDAGTGFMVGNIN